MGILDRGPRILHPIFDSTLIWVQKATDQEYCFRFLFRPWLESEKQPWFGYKKPNFIQNEQHWLDLRIRTKYRNWEFVARWSKLSHSILNLTSIWTQKSKLETRHGQRSENKFLGLNQDRIKNLMLIRNQQSKKLLFQYFVRFFKPSSSGISGRNLASWIKLQRVHESGAIFVFSDSKYPFFQLHTIFQSSQFWIQNFISLELKSGSNQRCDAIFESATHRFQSRYSVRNLTI